MFHLYIRYRHIYGARNAVFDVKPAHAIFCRFVDQKNKKPEFRHFSGTLPPSTSSLLVNVVLYCIGSS